MLLTEIGGEEFIEWNFTTQKLEIKLLKHFGDKIVIHKGKTRRGNIIFSSSITVEDAFRREANMKRNIDTKAREVVFALRSEILQTLLLENWRTIKDILKGEVQVWDIASKFFKRLICGPGIWRAKSASKVRKVKSVSEDGIFAVTSALKEPLKHLQLGMAITSLTGSGKDVDLLNRLGYCVIYSTIEELETELTFEATKEKKKTLNGMSLNPANNIGLAFDNFDRYVDTVSRIDPLHDTVGNLV